MYRKAAVHIVGGVNAHKVYSIAPRIPPGRSISCGLLSFGRGAGVEVGVEHEDGTEPSSVLIWYGVCGLNLSFGRGGGRSGGGT